MNKVLYLIFVSLLLFSSCQKKENPPPKVRVEAGTAVQKDVKDYINAIGNVFEYSIVEIRPQVQGILEKVFVKQGDFVKPGDVLFQIDSRPYQQALDESLATLAKDKASMELAKSTVNRYNEAAKKDFVSPLNYEQFLSNLAQAEAQVAFDTAAVEIAKINLGYCTLYATIAGKVGVYNIYPGNLVVVNDPNALIEIRQLDPVDIRFSIPQKDFQEVQKDEMTLDYKFEVFLPYEENRKFEGTLYFVDNHIDLQNGMILLKGKIPNENLQLWPGQYVQVRLFTKTLKAATVVPYAAIQVGQQGNFVYRIKPDNTVEVVAVTLGPRANSDVSITGDIKPGDMVVTNGQLNLRNGLEVDIVKKEEGKS